MAGQIFSAYKETLERFPVALPEMTNGLMHFGPSPVQIIISGPENEEKTQALIQVSNKAQAQVPGLPRYPSYPLPLPGYKYPPHFGPHSGPEN